MKRIRHQSLTTSTHRASKQFSWARACVTALVAGVMAASCGGKEDKDGGGGGEHHPGGPDGPMGNNCGPQGCASTAPKVTANLTGAIGLLVLDTTQGASLTLHNEGAKSLGLPLLDEYTAFSFLPDDYGSADAEGGAGERSLAKVDGNGEVKDALSVEKPSNQFGPGQMKLPRILTIAVSPKSKHVYLHFEQAFQHKDAPAGVDVWNTPGYRCQIFKVKGGTLTDLQASEPQANNLECIDDQHEIDNWQANRVSVFQFDKDDNVYYPGRTMGNGGGHKTVVYKRTSDGTISEVINANIQVQDFLVTKNGGVFYTGSTANGGNSHAGGFFRYVAPGGAGLKEIARDWWSFVFEPKEGATTDTAVFFGPDPRSASTASWNSACLFNFDPSADANASVSNVITCGSDIHSWIEMTRAEDVAQYGYNRFTAGWNAQPPTAWKQEYSARCTSSGQVFAGGGSQIQAIKQASNGDTYVIGNVRKKKKGQLTCNVSVKGAHCVVNSVPMLGADYDSSSECSTQGGQWVNPSGYCNSTIKNVNGDGSINYWQRNVSATNYSACMEKELSDQSLDDNTHPGNTTTPGTDAGCTANNTRCVVSIRWDYEVKEYNNVASDLCLYHAESAVEAQRVPNDERIWDKQVATTKAIGNTTVAAASTATITHSSPRFVTQNMSCQVAGSTGGGGGDWTEEFKALAKVDSTTKSLKMLSGSSEQAIRLWLVNDVPYFSSFDSTNRKYFLNRYVDGASQRVAENFEAYNVSEGESSTTLFYDGLDFSNNTYSFGSMGRDGSNPTRKSGLTGTVKTIVILPK